MLRRATLYPRFDLLGEGRQGGLAIYQRLKLERQGQKPVWRYKRVEERRGGKTGHLTGPFYIRPTRQDGTQPWVTLDAESFEEAKAERNNKQRGAELAAENSAGRTLISDAVSKFLDQKRRKKSVATASNYEFILNEFQEQIQDGERRVGEVHAEVP